MEPTENAHQIHNTDERHPGRDFDATENQYNDVQHMAPIYTEDQVMPGLNYTQASETLYIATTLINPTTSGVPTGLKPTTNAHLMHDTHERQLGRDFDVIGKQYNDAQLTGLTYTGNGVMPDRVRTPINEITYFESSSETPNTIWATTAMTQEQVASHDSFHKPDVHNPGELSDDNYEKFFKDVNQL